MDFSFSEEQNMFRESVAKFVDSEVIPKADEMDREGEFPRELFRRAAELGYFGVRYPETIGGSGGDMTFYCILCEELARGSMSLAASVAMQCMMGTDFIYRYGTDAHREQLIKPAIKGEKIGSFCLTEPGAGSDLGGIQTTAKRDGDHYILNGTKMWATHSTVADFFTVLASRDKSKGVKGVDFFLVERDTPGLIIGKKIEKMGVCALLTGELSLENCRIPVENELCEREGQGLDNLLAILDQIRVMTGALGLGLARAAYKDAFEYAEQREAFGRPIGKFQAIRHKFADMATDIHASKLLVYQGAWLIDRGVRCNIEAAIVKLFATEAANRCADQATRILASYGFATEYAAERYFRDGRFLLLGGGTSELLKNIIGRRQYHPYQQ